MKINVICSDKGWIYSKFVKMFKKYSEHQILLNSKEKCDITHYLPYYEIPKSPKHPCTIWASHQENRKDLYNKFISSAKSADFVFSHSKKYMEVLKEHGIQNVVQVMPGVDLDIFKPRSTKRPKNNKLVLGYVGRQYTSSNRKNPSLLDKIDKLPFVDLRITGGKIRDRDIPKFYQSLDFTIQTATIEGGSMAITESLACGTPVVSFNGVGVTNEFGFGVLKVSPGNENFIKYLESIYNEGSCISLYRQQDNIDKMREQVLSFTWENFVKGHDLIWNKFLMP